MKNPETTSPHVKSCQGCGVVLPVGKPGILCPKCLWTGAAKSSAPLEEEDTLTELSELLPDFEWLEVIGRGGMGTVYKARQKRLDRLVAVKVLSEEISVESRFASRFEREAKILARLNHPHIVTIHDFGQELDIYYLVMEYVDGIDLAKLLRRGDQPVESSIRMARQLCSALVFAHERGILHRDIKPANILVDADGLVKIADFGLAKLGPSLDAGGTLTQPGTTMGTPRYMAPEQWEDPDTIDHRADIFAFGMIFYELLTSEVPSGLIELPSTKTPVDPRADDIIRKCLAPDPNNRYAQASDLEADLAALDRTTSVTNTSRKEDSWLRPPPVTLVEDDASEAVTVIDSFANRDRIPLPQTKAARTRLTGWSCVLLALAILLGFMSWMNNPKAQAVSLMTVPALDGPWWFDEMPYLIPPVREQLEKAEDFEFPQTAAGVRRFKERTNKAVRLLSETSDDSVLSVVLESLLKRSVNADNVLRSIPDSLASENPAWEHTRGNLAHLLGDHQVAEERYRKALRAYRTEPSGHRGLIGLCLSDLARSQAASGRSEDAAETFDRAMDSVTDRQAPFFRVSCLAGRADACRRFEAWEEAERSLLEARNVLEDAGVEMGHPMMTYIHQRFGWLYLDDWKLKDGLHAFTVAIQSRKRWLDTAGEESLSTEIRQQHDEMALAMCQRYAGYTDKAIVGYEGVRQALHAMRQRVNRTPSAYREWTNRYYNNSERLGDCYLFTEAAAQQASHHFQQAASDLKRELDAMNPDIVPVFRPQYGRLLTKAAIAQVLADDQKEPLRTLSEELAKLELEGNNKTLLALFVVIGQIIQDARGHGTAENTAMVARLSAAVEANQDRQFGRDVRELFLIACRELATRCEGENAQRLASVITRLLPRDPVDQSVLPFLRPHFDRLIDLRMRSQEVNWDLIRDIHWAKTGSRLGEDLPKEPIMMFYLKPDAGYLIQFDPKGTFVGHRLNGGFSNLEAVSTDPAILRILSTSARTHHYWSDQGLIPSLDPDRYPFKVNSGANVR